MANEKRKSNKFRAASISLATPSEDGTTYDNGGVIFCDTEYPGSGSILLELDHPTRVDDNGYPVRGKAIAVNYSFPPEEGSEEAEEIAVDISGSYLNVTFWHAIERSPKAKDKPAPAAKKPAAKKPAKK
jgi:hypothetical protein